MIHFGPDIDRKFILERVSEEEIFEAYGVPVQSGNFRSPLRVDRHPTCRFYRKRTNNRLILHDFSGHFRGDCFDLVMFIKRVNFYDACRDIAKTFKIISGDPRKPQIPGVVIKQSMCEIRIASKGYDRKHLDYWEDYGITFPTLQLFEVRCVDKVWLNGSIYYNSSFAPNPRPVFAYWFGGYDYKIYFPFRLTDRFLHNNPDILQGYAQLPMFGDMVVITKAMKDVMCLHEFGIPAVAPMSETHVPSDDALIDLKSRFRKVYALYDRDSTGMRSLINLRRRGVAPLLMPKGTTKDFSDMCKLDYSQAKHLVDVFCT